MLNQEQRSHLLRIARESIAATLDGRRPELPAVDEVLQRPAGAFVTLTIDGELRGCIGSIHPVAPLYRAVSDSAINAAFRDPRFYPLRKDEYPHIHIEISVMGPIEVVNDVEEIQVGRDGLIVSRGRNAGLASAASRDRIRVGSRHLSPPDLRQSRARSRQLEASGLPDRALRRRSFQRTTRYLVNT